MGRETERRRAGSLGEEKRRPVQMLVPRRPGPDRRQRNQVREVQGVDERLADVGVDMAWQAAEPGRSEEHTSELQSLMRISYADFCLKKKTKTTQNNKETQ